MKRRGALAAVALLLVGSVVTGLHGKGIGDIPAGTGYAAQDLCSRTMVSKESPGVVLSRYLEPKVEPLPAFWQVQRVPEQRVVVRTWLPFLSHERTAIYREGLGCTVIPPGATEAAVRAQPFEAAPLPPENRGPWPLGEGAVETSLLGAPSLATIEAQVRALFDGEDGEAPADWNTTALLVARHGHLVYERYGQGHRRGQRQLGWSMTKTVTALIAGTLAGRGMIALDQPVGLVRWRGTDKAAITWRALLNMAPGLAWFEGYAGASDATEMLYSQPDQGGWAADRPLTSKPGTVFNYSTGFTNIAMLRMRQLLGDDPQAIYDHYQHALFEPLGIRGGLIEADASGTPVGGARGFLRPVDWLRLGLLVEQGGVWRGVAIVPASWVAFMTAASPADPQYGGFMWRKPSPWIAPELQRRLPDGLVYFAGHQGQFIIVVPSHDLVVLRMGVAQYAHEGPDPILNAVLTLVAELLDAD